MTIRREIPEKYKTLSYFQKQIKLGLTDFAIAAYMLHPEHRGKF
jgi:hypothetical protein